MTVCSLVDRLIDRMVDRSVVLSVCRSSRSDLYRLLCQSVHAFVIPSAMAVGSPSTYPWSTCFKSDRVQNRDDFRNAPHLKLRCKFSLFPCQRLGRGRWGPGAAGRRAGAAHHEPTHQGRQSSDNNHNKEIAIGGSCCRCKTWHYLDARVWRNEKLRKMF